MRPRTIPARESATFRTRCHNILAIPNSSGTSAPDGCYAAGGIEVGKTEDRQVKEIEATQEALRESIEETKKLADKAQRLLQQHKKTIERRSD
jgi:hypothetical protein